MKYHWEEVEPGTRALFAEGMSWDGGLDLSSCPAVIIRRDAGLVPDPHDEWGVSGSLFEGQQVFSTPKAAQEAAEAALLEAGDSLE